MIVDLAGRGLVITNGDDALDVYSSGTFTFATQLDSGQSYEVQVATQPEKPVQTCTVANGNGTIDDSSVADVEITCVTHTYTVGGTVSGLEGSGLVLNLNDQSLAISGNGTFTFETPLLDASTYNVFVQSYPNSPLQVCTVSNGQGVMDGANVTDIAVTCEAGFSVGGTVNGLAGSGLTLRNNNINSLVIAENGAFTFTRPLADGQAYNVSVFAQPTNLSQTCAVTDGAGTIAAGNITNVSVDCVTNSFAVGGSVVGLRAPGLVLRNNGADDLPIDEDGAFVFPTVLLDGSPYHVTVHELPATIAHACDVHNGTGELAGSDISSVQVHCAPTELIADAGTYGFVPNGTLLDASDSFVPGGVPATYTWSEVSSHGVIFVNNGSPNPHDTAIFFAFPDGEAVIEVTVQVEVDLDDGDPRSDQASLKLYRPDFAYVTPSGDGDGSAPDHALNDIQLAIDYAASTARLAVAVGEGDYSMNSAPFGDGSSDPSAWITLVNGISLYGGYAQDHWERDAFTYHTTIKDISTDTTAWGKRIFHVPADIMPNTSIDGFHLYPSVGSSASAVYAAPSAAPRIRGNVIMQPTDGHGNAIHCQSCSAIIDGNVLNTHLQPSIALGASTSITSHPVIHNNIFELTNPGSRLVVGIIILGQFSGTIDIANNHFVASETDENIWTAVLAGGESNATIRVYNNVFHQLGGSCLMLASAAATSSFATVRNNNFIGCDIVLDDVFGMCDSDGEENAEDHECTLDELEARTDLEASGNIAVDPVLGEDYQLTASSPVNMRQGGVDLHALGLGILHDFFGNQRTNLTEAPPNDAPSNDGAEGWSIGAFEYDDVD